MKHLCLHQAVEVCDRYFQYDGYDEDETFEITNQDGELVAKVVAGTWVEV